MARPPTKVVNQPKQPINSINVSIAQYKLTTGQSCHDKQTKLSINQVVNQPRCQSTKVSISPSCQSIKVVNQTKFSITPQLSVYLNGHVSKSSIMQQKLFITSYCQSIQIVHHLVSQADWQAHSDKFGMSVPKQKNEYNWLVFNHNVNIRTKKQQFCENLNEKNETFKFKKHVSATPVPSSVYEWNYNDEQYIAEH